MNGIINGNIKYGTTNVKFRKTSISQSLNNTAFISFHSKNTAFTVTERGQWKLIKDGYLYILQKNLTNYFNPWECALRRKGHCKARVKLNPNDDFVEQTNQHTHLPSQTNCKVAKVKAAIKRRATETVITNQQILAEQLEAISEGAAINLPVVQSFHRNIRSVRQFLEVFTSLKE